MGVYLTNSLRGHQRVDEFSARVVVEQKLAQFGLVDYDWRTYGLYRPLPVC